MKASKALTVSVSIFRGQISWQFSLSKNNISPAASDLELILFHCNADQLWTHTQSNNKTKCLKWILLTVKNLTPPFAHLLARSHNMLLFMMTLMINKTEEMLVVMVLFITVVKRICAVLSSVSCFILSGQQWWSHELDHQADTVCWKKVSTAYVLLRMSTDRWLLSMATWHSWKFAQMWKRKVGTMS